MHCDLPRIAVARLGRRPIPGKFIITPRPDMTLSYGSQSVCVGLRNKDQRAISRWAHRPITSGELHRNVIGPAHEPGQLDLIFDRKSN
jgi:hypothetical protein